MMVSCDRLEEASERGNGAAISNRQKMIPTDRHKPEAQSRYSAALR